MLLNFRGKTFQTLLISKTNYLVGLNLNRGKRLYKIHQINASENNKTILYSLLCTRPDLEKSALGPKPARMHLQRRAGQKPRTRAPLLPPGPKAQQPTTGLPNRPSVARRPRPPVLKSDRRPIPALSFAGFDLDRSF